jgi:glucoamylase
MSNDGTNPTHVAFGHPGILPKWTSSSKEGVGTAYSTSSRIWFTVSHGILNEVYYPTIDRPQIRDLQFLVTDGESFFHEEKRDLDSEIEYIERDTLGYSIVNSDPEGRYLIRKEIISDPHQPCVLTRARIEASPEWSGRLRVYALLAPHLEVGGWGNSSEWFDIAGMKILMAWKRGTHLAMGVNTGFLKMSCGYVGASDGWNDLRDNFHMDWEFGRADNGNIAVIGEIDTSQSDEFTLGLAFGDGFHAAVCTLTQSLSVPFREHRKDYVEQWHRVCCDIPFLDRFSQDHGRLYRISHSLLLAHEDKTFPGALIASSSIPWGQSKGDEDLGGYHLVWTRDMVNSVTGLLACDDTATANQALVYLACSQRSDGGFPQNFWIDGTPYWGGIQLDEVAFPIMLAWRLWRGGNLREFNPYPMVRKAAAYLIRQGPMTQQERWEENSGYSPSTLAATISALICAADFCRARDDEDAASFLEEYADFLESHVEAWTVTTQGTLVPDISRHYIRIHPTTLHDPSPDEDPNHGMLALANRPPGEPWEFPAKDIVDAGFLELVRYGVRKPGDALIEDSLKVVDSLLKVDTPHGPCWHRYNNDGYGERPDGGPYQGWGRGRAWPLLTGERGHYELAADRDVAPYVRAMENFASRGGMLPEQVWDEPDRPELDLYFGQFSGAAMPLMWAHAEYIKLLRSVADNRVFDLIPAVAERYRDGGGRKDLEVWKPIRRVKQVRAGHVLRIQAPEPFSLHYTTDEWNSIRDSTAKSSGLNIHFLDIPIDSAQEAPVRFTFFWLDREEWDGRDYKVDVRP